MIDWSSVLNEIDNALKFFRIQGVKPTLRTLFYYLHSKGLIPNTRSAYKRLSAKLVEARKKGRYKWDFIEDKTRTTLGYLGDYYSSEKLFESYVEMLKAKIEKLNVDELIENYVPKPPAFHVDMWACQPKVVEIWVEKEALAKTIHNWVRDLYVPVRVNRGYPSWTFIYNNVKTFMKTLRNHSKIVVYYLGDLDPSGVDIQRFLQEALQYFNVSQDKVEFKRLAVTEKQVEKHNLPPRPEDAETIAKLRRDPRTRKYAGKYIVELDALIAYAPKDFKETIRNATLSIWDSKTYEKLKKEAEKLKEKAEKIREKYVQEAKKKILQQLNQR